MKSAKQELIDKAWREARKKGIKDKNGFYGVSAAEALDWLADEYLLKFVNGG